MVTNSKRQRERGTAMMMAMFALMLLSAVGLGMMYAAGTETSINANYREKQMAMYAANAGVQEARDRLQPSNGDIGAAVNAGALLTGLPASDGSNIIYIINPRAGETINPWQHPSANNVAFDTELCQEHIPGLTGTLGVPCSDVPPSGTFSSSYDNGALTYAGPYKFNPPLLYKWVRITLKANNATSIPVNGDPSSRIQVCWDGKNQIPLPTGYGSNCAPAGAGKVLNISLDPTQMGSGYSDPLQPLTVSISGGGGTGAAATASLVPHTTTISSGQIHSIDVCPTCGGSGYTTAVPPLITITGDGSLATASAIFTPAGKEVESVSLGSAGVPAGCYGAAPSVAIVPNPSGSGATAHATLSGGGTTTTCIRSISFTGNCNTHKGDSNIAFSATGGLAGTVNFDANGKVIPTSVKITNPGSGYAADPAVTVSGCTGGNALSSAVVRGYNVSTLVRDQKGFGYDFTPLVKVAAPDSGGTPTGTATLGATITGGTVTGVTVTNGGSGYTTATATFSAPPLGGSTATGVPTIASVPSTTVTYTLECCTLTAGGSNYSGPPNVTINGGGGSGAKGIATVGSSDGKTWYGQVFQVTSLAVTASGARAMTQVEVATPVRGMVPGGALTLAGPAPASPNKLYDQTHSATFQINGNDASSCDPTNPNPPHPAIGVYDDPSNPTPVSAVDNVVNGITKPENYVGAQPSPDVENVFGSLGDTMGTPTGLDDFAKAVANAASPGCTFGNNPAASVVKGNGCFGSPTDPKTTVINGDFTTAGNPTGYGILLVTGTLYLSGNFSWHGVILVIGQAGITQLAGGGNAEIVGSMFVAKTRDSSGNLLPTLGSPKVDWSGGGGNGILYDHCWSDNLLSKIPFTPPVTARPLKVLSTRTVTY